MGGVCILHRSSYRVYITAKKGVVAPKNAVQPYFTGCIAFFLIIRLLFLSLSRKASNATNNRDLRN